MRERSPLKAWVPMLIALSACGMFALERWLAGGAGLLVAALLARAIFWRRPRLIRPSAKRPIVIDRLRWPRG